MVLRIRFACFLVFLVGLNQLGLSQSSPKQIADAISSEPLLTIQSSTRMVTVQIVAKDRQGHHANGLTANDFHVFEMPLGKDKQEQKIASFREVKVADLNSQNHGKTQISPGIYTNAIIANDEPVPPTILLLDGLNTELKYQAQVHRQMMSMLRSLPKNVPVAVFLFGNRLTVLQDFTTDPRRLQAALDKAMTASGEKLARLDPRDDPDMISAHLDQLNGQSLDSTTSGVEAATGGAESTAVIPEWLVDTVKRFEQEVYATSMDMRVEQTVDALLSLGRHVAGYPGRKNLLWISTSFPVYLNPLIDDSGKPITDLTGLNNAGWRNYGDKLQVLSAVLSESRVAVYPINPAGVQGSVLFEAENRVRDTSGRAIGNMLQRETLMRGNEQDSMEMLANGTGGQVCTGTNDLGDCVRKAVEDSSSFYEISYYPISHDWNGEYRKIVVKAKNQGLHLSYRQGYYARKEGGKSPKDQKEELQQAACNDYLDATSVPFSAKRLPSDSPGQLKFYLTIDPSALTLTPTSDGGHGLNLSVAVCMFDKKGAPYEFMSDALQRNFDPHEFQLLNARGLPHIVAVPGPTPSALRLLVRDIPSGRLGSVDVSLEDSDVAMEVR